VGWGLAYLIARMSDWTHRRSEQVSFMDAKSAHRRVAVTFTYPAARRPVGGLVEISRAPVPLALLSKEDSSGPFTVADEQSRALAVASRTESERMAALCLEAIARGVARGGPAGGMMPKAIVQALHKVAELPAGEAARLLLDLAGMVEANTEWRELSRLEIVSSAATVRALDATRPHAAVLRRLFASTPFTTIARMLAIQVPLLVFLSPGDAGNGERRLFVYEYDEPLRAHRAQGHALGSHVRSVLAALSWRPADYEFEIPALGRESAYRIDVTTPTTAQIVRGQLTAAAGKVDEREIPPWRGGLERMAAGAWAGLRGARGPARAPVPDGFAGARRALAEPARALCVPYADRIAGDAHALWLDAGPSDSSISLQVDPAGPNTWRGVAMVRLQAGGVGLLRTAPWLAAITAALLLVGKGHLSQIEDHVGSGASAAILLVVPTLLATVIARAGEHPMVTRLLRGVRIALGAVGVGSFAAAASLTGAFSHATNATLWTIAAGLVSAAAAVLIVSSVLNVARMRSRSPAVALLR